MVVYTLTVSNLGPSDATGVVVTDELPPNFVDATGNPQLSGTTLTWPATNLPANDVVSYTVRVTSPAAGTVINTASVTAATADPVASNNTSTSTTPVLTANLDVSVTAPATVVAGSSLTYTIDVVNAGPGNAVGISVQSAVPAGATFVSATGGITPDASGILTWSEPALALSAALQYQITVTAPPFGTVISSATVGSSTDDQDPTNNSGSASTVVTAQAADVQVDVTATSAVAVDDTIEYTIVVTNNGPGVAIGTVTTFEMPSPADVTFRSATGAPIQNGRTLTWSAVDIAPLGSVTYTVKVTADRAATVTGTGSAASTISPDPDSTNNASAQQTVVT